MEITNNNPISLSQVDSPSQPSDGNPRTKSSKKAGQPGEFDQTMAGLVGVPQTGVQLSPEAAAQKAAETATGAQGAVTQNPIANGGVSIPGTAAQAAMSKEQMQAQARSALQAQAKAAGQARVFPNTEGAMNAKSEQAAAGTIAGAFVAGPNQPWKGAWAFGGENPIETPSASSQAEQAIAKLREQLARSGGDETQIKQAGSDATEALAAYLNQVGAEVEGAPAAKTDGQPNAKMALVGGSDYLAMIQGGQAGGQGAQAGGGGAGGGFGGNANAQARMAEGAKNGGQGFKLIQGGLDSNVLDNRVKNSKDSDSSLGTLAFGGATTQQLMDGAGKTAAPQMPTLTGQVVPGSMMRDRLTTDSLHQVSNTIRGMSGKGGGEMRIRMNPGNLGELAIRVQTDGKSVGLQVQASDPAAKKILEESLSSLKDGLAAQNLTLGRVDIAVKTEMDSQNQSAQQQSSQSGQSAQNFAGSTGWDSGQGGNRGSYSNDEGSAYGSLAAEPARAASSARYAPRSTGTSGRLDLMA